MASVKGKLVLQFCKQAAVKRFWTKTTCDLEDASYSTFQIKVIQHLWRVFLWLVEALYPDSAAFAIF